MFESRKAGNLYGTTSSAGSAVVGFVAGRKYGRMRFVRTHAPKKASGLAGGPAGVRKRVKIASGRGGSILPSIYTTPTNGWGVCDVEMYTLVRWVNFQGRTPILPMIPDGPTYWNT